MDILKRLKKWARICSFVRLKNTSTNYLALFFTAESEEIEVLDVVGLDDISEYADQDVMVLDKRVCPSMFAELCDCVGEFSLFSSDDFLAILSGEVKPKDYEQFDW